MSLLLLLLLPASSVWARDIEPGDTYDGDLTLVDEDLFVAADATVNGNVVVLDADAEVAGVINGDIVLLGGDLTLAETAVINGSCALVGGSLTSNSESGCETVAVPNFVSEFAGTLAVIPGIEDVMQEVTADLELEFQDLEGDLADLERDLENFDSEFASEIDGHREFDGPHMQRGRGFWGDIGSAFLNSLVLGVLAFGVASIAPQHLTTVRNTIHEKPFASGVVGLLTSFAVPSLIAILALVSTILLFVCIGILGYPVILALAFGLAAAALLGWVALGGIAGDWLGERLDWHKFSMPAKTAFGTAILTLVLGLLDAIPLVPGGLLIAVGGMVGLGAAALTQLGRKPYPHLPPVDDDKVEVLVGNMPDEGDII